MADHDERATSEQAFLRALTGYLTWRLDEANLPAPDLEAHVDAFADLLRALGADPQSTTFKGLLEHMQKMEGAGRIDPGKESKKK
jgi:hypothetical protein